MGHEELLRQSEDHATRMRRTEDGVTYEQNRVDPDTWHCTIIFHTTLQACQKTIRIIRW